MSGRRNAAFLAGVVVGMPIAMVETAREYSKDAKTGIIYGIVLYLLVLGAALYGAYGYDRDDQTED